MINKDQVLKIITNIDILLNEVNNEVEYYNNLKLDKDFIKTKIKEIDLKCEQLKREADYYNSLQNALKLILNGTYGAFTTPYFILYIIAVGSTITAQGRNLTQTMDEFNEDYWYNQWHKDFTTHERLCVQNIRRIKKSLKTNVSIYCDTDSVSADSEVTTSSGIKTIEQFYNENIDNKSDSTIFGHESVTTEDLILDYSFERGLYYGEVDRIIRHKVTKEKWRVTLESGKVINVTNDHSLIVYRNGVEMEIMASEILDGDEMIAVNICEYDDLEF